MKFVTFQRRKDSLRGGLLLEGNRLLDLGLAYTRRLRQEQGRSDTQGLINALRGVSSSILEILRIGEDALTDCYTLERAANEGELEDCCFSIGSSHLAAPLPDPPLLVHFNLYEAHALAEFRAMREELNADLPTSWALSPMFFFGNPCAIGGPNDDVEFPFGEEENDVELQIAAVLCEDVRDVTPEDADAAILGYTAAGVWVSRSAQRRGVQAGSGPSEAKGLAITMGPALITKDELFDPEDLTMRVGRSRELVWEGKAGEGKFSFAEAISHASQGRLLPAGTVILSGPPAGAAMLHHGAYLKSSDVVELTIEAIGTMRSTVLKRTADGNVLLKDREKRL